MLSVECLAPPLARRAPEDGPFISMSLAALFITYLCGECARGAVAGPWGCTVPRRAPMMDSVFKYVVSRYLIYSF